MFIIQHKIKHLIKKTPKFYKWPKLQNYWHSLVLFGKQNIFL